MMKVHGGLRAYNIKEEDYRFEEGGTSICAKHGTTGERMVEMKAGLREEKKNTEKERKRAEKAEAEVQKLKELLARAQVHV